jgi:hypothetical protein
MGKAEIADDDADADVLKVMKANDGLPVCLSLSLSP